MICTLLIHPVEPQLSSFIGPAAVHQAWECEDQSVGPSGWNLGHRYPGQREHECGRGLQGHLLPQTQLAVTVQTPREDESPCTVKGKIVLL